MRVRRRKEEVVEGSIECGVQLHKADQKKKRNSLYYTKACPWCLGELGEIDKGLCERCTRRSESGAN